MRRSISRGLGGVALLSLALSAPLVARTGDEQALLAARRIWWHDQDKVFDVAGLTPLERVPGAGGRPLPVAASDIDPAAVSAALAYVNRARTQSLLVWHKGALRLEWYGAGSGRDSRSSPASMPKPVLALAVGAAVARGLIHLDDPVSRWLVEWRGDPRGAITVRDLLQMRSGLAKDGLAINGGRGEAMMYGTRLETTLLQTQAAVPPGQRFDYNNVDNNLLALILQRATGQHYARWLSRTVWRPIGASDSTIWLDRPGGLARTFCCLLATGQDWVRVGLLIKDRGAVAGRQLLPADWIDAMTAPSPTNPNYGFQIWRTSPYAPQRGYGTGSAPPVPSREPILADDMVMFDGAIGERVYISRSRDLVIVRIGNSIPDWDDSVLPNLILRGLR